MDKKLSQMEQDLIKKYTKETILAYKHQFDDAVTLILIGTEVEDKKGLEQAQKEYYNEAEEILAEIPEDYKEFRRLLAETF